MKKLIVSLFLATALMSAPAHAGNKTVYVISGVLGGLLLGEIIHNNAHAAPAPRPVYVVRPRRVYPAYQECWEEPRSHWSSYRNGYVTRYVTVCQ